MTRDIAWTGLGKVFIGLTITVVVFTVTDFGSGLAILTFVCQSVAVIVDSVTNLVGDTGAPGFEAFLGAGRPAFCDAFTLL